MNATEWVLSPEAELLAELVRLSPLELDERRLLHLAYLVEELAAGRGAPRLTGLRFMRSHPGLQAYGFIDALSEGEAAGRVRRVTRPSYLEMVRTFVRKGHHPRPASRWEVRAWASHLIQTTRHLTDEQVRLRVLASAPAGQAVPGAELDLALGARPRPPGP